MVYALPAVCSVWSASCLAQSIFHSSYNGYSSTSLIEINSSLILALEEELVNDGSQYGMKFIRMDSNLNQLLIEQPDFSPFLGDIFGISGQLFEIDGKLEFAGAALKRESIEPEPNIGDSLFFVRAVWNENFELIDMQIEFMRATFAYPKDISFSAQNDEFWFAFAGPFIAYWVAEIGRSEYLLHYSETRYHELALVSQFNPNRVTKILNFPDSDHIALRTTSSHIDIYDSLSQYDYTYQIPSVNIAGVFHPAWSIMSNAAVFFEDSYVIGSNYQLGQIVHLSNAGEFIHEFHLALEDSISQGSLHHCLAADVNKNLYLGMHLQGQFDDFPTSLKVIKCDTLGTVFWQHTFSEVNLEHRYLQKEILVTGNGDVIMVADRYSPPDSEHADAVIVYKLNANGILTGLHSISNFPSDTYLFPNPSQNQIHLDAIWEGSKYEIIDMGGRVLMRDVIKDPHINVQSLQAGVYVLRVTSGRGANASFVLKKE